MRSFSIVVGAMLFATLVIAALWWGMAQLSGPGGYGGTRNPGMGFMIGGWVVLWFAGMSLGFRWTRPPLKGPD